MKKYRMLFAASLAAVCLSFLVPGCASVNMEDTLPVELNGKEIAARNIEDEMLLNQAEEHRLMIDEDMKEVDVEKTVVYVEKPVYYPVEKQGPAPVKGKAAAQRSLDAATQLPEKWNGGKMFYDFQENFVYEIYCQPYRITDVALEPGEMVLEHPFLSESQVWEMGAGVSRTNGQDTQHFYLKPDKSNLITSMIIITDRRTYHLLLKSFKDCYMAMVEFEYPNTMPYTIKTDAMEERARINSNFRGVNGIDPRFLSFDYKMSYSIFKKPIWLPKRVYDDGMRTYIQMDERVLHTRAPVIFNKRNERINYRVDKNLIVIDELVEKLTMRNGKQKVVIKKKTYFEDEDELDQKKIEEEMSRNEEQPRRGWQLHMQFPEKKPEEKKEPAKKDQTNLPPPVPALPPEDNPYNTPVQQEGGLKR